MRKARGKAAAAQASMAIAAASAKPVTRKRTYGYMDPRKEEEGRRLVASGRGGEEEDKSRAAKRQRVDESDSSESTNETTLLSPPLSEPLPPWESIASLNDDQRNMLWVPACGESFMVVGPGGTGKTFTVQTLLRVCMSGQMWLPSALMMQGVDLEQWIGGIANLRLIVEYTYSAAELRRTVIPIAPSGPAATLYAPYGMTIHSFLGLSVPSSSSDNKADESNYEQQYALELACLELEAKRCRRLMEKVAKSPSGFDPKLEEMLSTTRAGRMISLKLLIIDEAFMARPQLFDLLERTMRRVRGVDKFMGGCLVVPTGDPLQLPPVTKGLKKNERLVPIYEKYNDAFRLCQTWNVNVRQADDPLYAGILSKLRVGKGLTEDEIRALMECVDSPPENERLQKLINECAKTGRVPPLRIWPRNEQVDEKNATQIKRVPGAAFRLGASFRIETFAKRSTYMAYLKVNSETQVPPLTDVDDPKGRSNRLPFPITARDLVGIKRVCDELLARQQHTGGTFKPGMPIRIRTNMLKFGLGNGTRAILLHRVGDLGSRKFLGGLYDLDDPDVKSKKQTTFTLVRRKEGYIMRGGADPTCTVHSHDALKAYDCAMAAWKTTKVGPKPMVPNDDLTLERAGCLCNGILITACPDTPMSKTMVLPLHVISRSLELDSGAWVSIRMCYAQFTADFARTVDSAQGQTCEHIAVALNECGRTGQAYTGLSRVKSRKGLVFEHGQVHPDMFREGTRSFKRLFSVRDAHGKPDPQKLEFCTHEHDLPYDLKHHPTRDKWMRFQTSCHTVA